MCGIAGIYRFTSSYDPIADQTIVSQMLDSISHRGPDQKGIKQFANLTLGFVRLSIIDGEKHDIPYEDSNRNFAIAYNGEIYNHDTIRSSLTSKYHFKTNSDAETTLYNFIQKGVNSFDDYNGMYAFSIYDQSTRELYVVRDKTGEKPLYYYSCKDFFAFASEVKALLEIVKPEVNKYAYSYNAFEFTVGKETLFKDIYQLEPGEYIKAQPGGWQLHNYWKIWDNLLEIEDDYEQIKNDLSELIEDAIYLRTKNSVHEFGLLVSGGLDSSLVAAISKPDYLYTAHYDVGPDFDELKYAKEIAKAINRDLIIVEPKPEDFERTREQIAFHLDTPCTWTSFTLWMLLERASKDIKVLLTGDGADEIFSGYYRYLLLYHDEQIKHLETMQKYSYLINRYYGSAVDRYVRLINRCENQNDQNVLEYLNQLVGFYFDKSSEDVIHTMGITDFYTTMQVLLQMGDRISMAFSVENRSPFIDYRLMQFSYSMPSKYKINNGITKWILKEIARKFVPTSIVDRIDKRGFSAPLNRWFGWDKKGKYDRSIYRKLVYNDWVQSFLV